MSNHTLPRRLPALRRMAFGTACAAGAAAVFGVALAHAQDMSGDPAAVVRVQPVAATPTLPAGSSPSTASSMGSAASGDGSDAPSSDPVMMAMMVPGSSGTLHQGGYTFRTVDDPADPTFNQLLGINDRGRIVGYFGSGADAAHPNKGFRVRAPFRTFVDENVPGSVQTQVVGINDSGATVGFFVDGAGANVGFLSVGGTFTRVVHPDTDPAAPFNQLLGISDRGLAAGFYNDAAGAAHGYTYDTRTGRFQPVLLPVRADAVTATGVNNNGDVSGFYVVGKVTRGFLLERSGRFRRLSFGAGTNTQVLGLDSHDRLVGSFVDAAGLMHGFVWAQGSVRRIDAPAGSGGTLVNGLNNAGQLVGFYVDAAGNTHGFTARRDG